MIRIEDNFEDVLGKAMAGLGLSVGDLSEATGLEPARIESLLDGAIRDDALLAVARPLGLSPDKLLDMAHRRWRPSVELPANVTLINTAFPVPGYAEMTVNSYLFWSDRSAAAVDTGAKADALLTQVAQRGLRLEALYITHTHRDHIAALDAIRGAHPGLTVYCPEGEALSDAVTLGHGAKLSLGRFEIEARGTSGHSPGALSYLAKGDDTPFAFVGDALFCLSMGKAPKNAYPEALENNRRELLGLPENTVLCPGHGPVTTVADEKERNPFF
jgi:glyoxylase-like metal-dependent hydrolase (beta-lactamase superfamily II)